MSKVTMKAFIENSNIDASLIRAVVRQMGGWESFKESAKDVSHHGADRGFSGFIYYSETEAFTKRNKKAVLNYVKQFSHDIGIANEFDLIASFARLDLSPSCVAEAIYISKSRNRTEVFNALAWFALEGVARAYIDFIRSL